MSGEASYTLNMREIVWAVETQRRTLLGAYSAPILLACGDGLNDPSRETVHTLA